jgi:hypothetical protein
MTRSSLILSITTYLCLGAVTASAQQPPHDVTALAKESQNPVGNLVSMPLQFNFNTGGDLEDATALTFNFQPVIPFRVTTNWNAIVRTILPIESLPGPEATRFSGIGNIQLQWFITSAHPGAFIWGVGPVLSLPTATSAPLQTGTWAAGPGVVLVKMTGPWVIGGVISQYWPAADAGGEPKTNQFVAQPAINYNFGKGYAVSFSPVITADWDAPDGQEWTVPMGLGVSRTTVFSGRPMSLGLQYYRNVVRPDGSPGQVLRFAITLLFPTATH